MASFEFKPNPNFKKDVLKAAEDKLGAKIHTEKEALDLLNRGGRASNAVLAHLADKGLIEVRDVTSNDTPPGERDLLFIRLTEHGIRVLESD